MTPNLSERAKTMKSSLDEVLSLFNKWKADKKLIVVAVSDGDPGNPDSFLFKITGAVKEISSSWVGIAGGPSYCCLKLVRPGARYDYIELRDPKLPITDQDRIDAEGLFEGILSVDFDDELFYVFNVLRVDLNLEPEEEPDEDPDVDEE
ncbi:MAG: hypothetical protein ABSF45_04740 [Terriglobia bacterium]